MGRKSTKRKNIIEMYSDSPILNIHYFERSDNNHSKYTIILYINGTLTIVNECFVELNELDKLAYTDAVVFNSNENLSVDIDNARTTVQRLINADYVIDKNANSIISGKYNKEFIMIFKHKQDMKTSTYKLKELLVSSYTNLEYIPSDEFITYKNDQLFNRELNNGDIIKLYANDIFMGIYLVKDILAEDLKLQGIPTEYIKQNKFKVDPCIRTISIDNRSNVMYEKVLSIPNIVTKNDMGGE